MNDSPAIRGRGAPHNPANRFEALAVVRDGWRDPEDPAPRTELLADGARSIVSHNDSPDVGFDTSVNPYRGCEHGCIYCYARPFHEYLGFSAGLDFETKILVKRDAPSLLRATLDSPSWCPQTILLSGVTDPYQPAERRLGLTRSCLKVLAEYGNPVAITTKNHLITRDADLLSQLAARGAAAVSFSITTLDETLARRSEPRASTPARRLQAISRLTEAGIPVGVNVAPVIPGLTEHELPRILAAAASAGARYAAYILLRLPHGVSGLFEAWLQRHYPERHDRILNRIRETRRGRLYDPRYEVRHTGEGEYARHIAGIFAVSCRRVGLSNRYPPLSTAAFRRRARYAQLGLFERTES